MSRGSTHRAANVVERLRGSVHLPCRLSVAREAVHEARRSFVHVRTDHRYLVSLALTFLPW